MIASIRHAAPPGLAAALAGLLVLGLGMATPRLAVAQTARTIETGGVGELTLCRDWLVFRSCHSYHHVAVPARFAIGDRLDLIFGSNVKEIDYRVVRIARDGEHCTVFDEAAGGADRLDVIPCRLDPPLSAAWR